MKKILCHHCGNESFLKTEKIYDGFTPVGEKKVCAFCKEEIASEEAAPLEEKKPEFLSDESKKDVCRFCKHYVLNPWTQKCVLRNEYVEALDSCDEFKAREK